MSDSFLDRVPRYGRKRPSGSGILSRGLRMLRAKASEGPEISGAGDATADRSEDLDGNRQGQPDADPVVIPGPAGSEILSAEPEYSPPDILPEDPVPVSPEESLPDLPVAHPEDSLEMELARITAAPSDSSEAQRVSSDAPAGITPEAEPVAVTESAEEFPSVESAHGLSEEFDPFRTGLVSSESPSSDETGMEAGGKEPKEDGLGGDRSATTLAASPEDLTGPALAENSPDDLFMTGDDFLPPEQFDVSARVAPPDLQPATGETAGPPSPAVILPDATAQEHTEQHEGRTVESGFEHPEPEPSPGTGSLVAAPADGQMTEESTGASEPEYFADMPRQNRASVALAIEPDRPSATPIPSVRAMPMDEEAVEDEGTPGAAGGDEPDDGILPGVAEIAPDKAAESVRNEDLEDVPEEADGHAPEQEGDWALVPQLGHGGSVFFVAWSADDRHIFTGSCGMLLKWDAENGRVLERIPLSATAISVSEDGRALLVGSSDRTAAVLDAETGQKVRSLKGHDDWIMAVAFSPDGQRAVTGSWDETARVWDCASGRELLRIKGRYGQIDAIVFSPDGRRIAIGSWDSTARIWDSRSGAELVSLAGHGMDVGALAFSADGRRIITGSGDGTARIWNAVTGEQELCLSGHSMDVNSVAFSPDGTRCLTGSWDATARVWDAATGEELFRLSGHSMNIDAVAFSHDGSRILTGSSDKSVRVWDARTGKPIRSLDCPVHVIELAAWSPDGGRLLVCSWNTASILDADTGVELVSLKGHTGQIGTVAWSPDGKRILLGSWDETARIWDGKNGDELLCLTGHTGNVSTVAFFPDGRRALTSSDDKILRVWDCENGVELFSMSGHSAFIKALAFLPDGTRLVTGSEDATARIWDTMQGKELFCLRDHSGPVEAVAFSRDGERVFTCSSDKRIRVWDIRTGDELALEAEGEEEIAWSPEGKRFITGSGEETARIWDSETGSRLLSLEGQTHWNNAAVWSPDGKRVAAVALCRLFVFDSATGKERFQHFSHEDGWLTLYPGGFYRYGGEERLALVQDADRSRPVDAAYAGKWRLRN